MKAKIITLLFILSIAYLLFTMLFFCYKRYYLPTSSFSGEISTSGTIQEIANNYLTIRFDANNQKKLFFDDKTTITVAPEYTSISLDNSKIKQDDFVFIKYNTKGDLLISLIDLGNQISTTLHHIKGKILSIDDQKITIRTWEENAKDNKYNINSEIKYYDWTDLSNKKEIARDQLKVNDDLAIDYDLKNNQEEIKNIYLLKKGPEEK